MCCEHGSRPFQVKNMVYRGLDQDGNAGVVFERMAQVLLRCHLDKTERDGQQKGELGEIKL